MIFFITLMPIPLPVKLQWLESQRLGNHGKFELPLESLENYFHSVGYPYTCNYAIFGRFIIFHLT